MQWFKDRRTATKLMLSFGFLALVMGGLGFLGIRGMAAIQASLNKMHQHHAVSIMHLGQANVHMVTTGRSVRGMMLRTDKAQIEERRRQVLAERQHFYDEFEAYQKSLISQEARAKAVE